MVNESPAYGIEYVHARQLLHGLNQLRQRRELCDVELCAGKGRVFAHRVVLSACSTYFNAMFTGTLAESKKEVIYLQEIEENALRLLVEFAYTGKVNVTHCNVQVLLPAANLLQLSKVKEACEEFLVHQLHSSNCLGIVKFAETYDCQELFEKAKDFVEDKFEEIISHEEFLQLRINDVLELLRSDNLNVSSEMIVFEACEIWVKYDISNRRVYVPDLVKCVRLPLLSIKFLSQSFQTHELVRESIACQNLLSEALKFRMVPEKRISNEAVVASRPRRAPKMVFALGGKNGLFATLNSAEHFDVKTEKWVEVASMNLRRFEFSAASLEGKVYAVGGLVCGIGIHSGTPFRYFDNSVEIYSPLNNTWSKGPPMNHSRSNHSVAVIGGILYALGGYDGRSYLKTVEYYCPKAAHWCLVQPMFYNRSCFATAVLDGYLYALGGYGPTYLSTVERYDPSKDCWEMMPAMSTNRINFGVGVVHGYLYVVGGHDGVVHLRSVERFDPVASEWTIVAPMNRPRTGLSVTVIDGMLYALGGHDGSSYLNLVQRYDPCTNKWGTLKSMTSSRCSFAVTTL